MYEDRPEIVIKAIVDLATCDDPFPDLAKLLTACERIRRHQDGTMPQDATSVRFSNHKALAAAWGLTVPKAERQPQ